MSTLTEADNEAAALEWLAALGWQTAHGADIAPGAPRGSTRICPSTRWTTHSAS